MNTNDDATAHAWIAAPGSRTASDIVLGFVLLIAGSIAIGNVPAQSLSSVGGWNLYGPALFPAIVGGLLILTGVALLLRGALLNPAQPSRWSLEEMAIIGVLIVAAQLVLQSTMSNQMMLYFGPAEFVAVMAFQMFVVLAIARLSRLRAVGMVLVGLLLAIVGADLASGTPRLTFGVELLEDGIMIPVVLLGLIAVADGVICLYSPSLFLQLYARQVAGWTAPKISAGAAIGMRIAAAIAVAAACYFVYTLNNSAFDVAQVLLFGLLGIAGRVFSWNRFCLYLAFANGALFEENIRRSMMISRNDPAIFLERPISGSLLFLGFGILAAVVLYRWAMVYRDRRSAQTGA